MTIKINIDNITSGFKWTVKLRCNNLGGDSDRILGGWAPNRSVAKERAHDVIERRTGS